MLLLSTLLLTQVLQNHVPVIPKHPEVCREVCQGDAVDTCISVCPLQALALAVFKFMLMLSVHKHVPFIPKHLKSAEEYAKELQ